VAYNALRSNVRAAIATMQVPEQSYISLPKGRTIYVGKNRRGDLQNILLYEVRNETNLATKVTAPRGRLEIQATNVLLLLFDATVIDVGSSTPIIGQFRFEFPLESARIAARKPGISDMTLSELRAELRRVELQTALPLPLDNAAGVSAEDRKRDLEKQLADLTEPIRVQIHRRLSFSFACFAFTLIGIPLGIRVHRRETNVGVAIALLLVFIYYGFILLIQSWEARPELAPHLLIWLPNFLFQAIGLALLWRANRGT
jgi:lipopolysaccharide export LptBFGC system permease protein LptF